MSESAKNDSSAPPVSVLLEIRGKKPVLERITFREEGGKAATLEPQKRDTTKAIATVLVLFRACRGCASFQITSKKKDKHLVKFIVSAVRETDASGLKGKIYRFADGRFLKLFLAPPDPNDFSYVDLDLKRPVSVTVRKDNLEVRSVVKLKKLAEQLAASGGWKLRADYTLNAFSVPSSAVDDPKTLPPPEEKIPSAIQEEHDQDHRFAGEPSGLLDKATKEKPNEGFIQTQKPVVLQLDRPAQNENELDDADVFAVPQFIDLANRASRKSELRDLLSAHPVVSVAGLSDSGKSFLVASFLNEHPRFRDSGSVFWHEPDRSGSEPLEVLIARLEQSFRLKGKSLFERSKQVMLQLEANNQLLVIDDFQSVDLGSYAVLVEAASRLKAPARLVLISQTNIGMTGDIPDLPRLEIAGYDRGELKHFLMEKRLSNLSDKVVDEFLQKTDGLPIAADWFVFMVNGLKRSPEQLLAGRMVISDRLRSWFNEIEAFVGEPASNMLQMLSLCDGPFNLGVVRMLCLQRGSGAFEEVFETLQRAYLVQSYSPFRWRLHQLIVELCRHQMSDEFKRRTHRSLGIYHRDNAQGVARRFSEEKALVWQAKACRHFQKAGDYVRWRKTVHRTIPKLKSRGFYRLIIQLLSKETKENPSKDLWLAYDCAHACLIIGWHEQGMAIIRPLVGQQMQNDPSLKVSIVRLYADLLDATGEPRLALEKLQELLDSADAKLARSRVLAQVKTAVIRLLTKLEEYGQAEKLSDELFAESKDDIGRAVALAGWGIVLKCTGRLELADYKLGQAVNLFIGRDKRGYGWSLSHHAICQRKLGNIDGASLMLREALQVKSDIEEASEEYLTFLRKAHPLFLERALAAMIESEIERASAQIRTLGKVIP